MKSTFYFIIKILFSLGLLAGLVVYVSPESFFVTIKSIDSKWLTGAVVLMPLFLYCRMAKWYLLVRQVVVKATFSDIIPSYLRGMALGMFTPARFGEVTRILNYGNKTSQICLFIVEKIIEVICLCVLTLFALSKLDIPGIVVATGAVIIIVLMVFGLKTVKKISLIILKRFLRNDPSQKSDILIQLKQLKVFGCTILSFACFFIFMFQVFFLIKGFGCNVSVDIILFFPVILLSNLAPFTIGGFGLREGTAILILGLQSIPDTVSMGSFFIVTVIDLLVPALIGIFIFAFQKKRNGGSKNGNTLSIYNESNPVWNEFWERRKKNPLGRLISLIRKNLITPALVNYVEKNTRPGTLIEAGCGTAEVSIGLAEKRGDRIILVDISEEALKQAEFNAFQAGISADVISCDISDLFENTGYIADGSAFNIGVIEHFLDCTPILHQMSAVSGQWALAVVPGRSIFWRTFISISFFLKLVPDGFYIHLFTTKELKDTAEKAGLNVIGISSTRIFGIIPYTGISFSQQKKARIGRYDKSFRIRNNSCYSNV